MIFIARWCRKRTEANSARVAVQVCKFPIRSYNPVKLNKFKDSIHILSPYLPDPSFCAGTRSKEEKKKNKSKKPKLYTTAKGI